MKGTTHITARVVAVTFLVVALGAVPKVAHAQSSTSSVSGIVAEKDGAVIPGATVVVKNNGTGVTTTIVTNGSGAFSAPALAAGTYTVTITLSGFKTVSIPNMRLVTSNPADLGKITLELGGVQETVEVVAGAELVQTQVATIAATVTGEQLRSLPMPSRNGAYALWALPGIDSTGGNARNTVISGLSAETYNVTLNGVNINDNEDKAGNGFQGNVRPTLDAIEEVTVTRASQGADSAGKGAVQIKYSTRSGNNQFKGTFYEYYRDKAMNTNYFFNELRGLPKGSNTLHQTGASFGGPIRRNKMFFFFNIERLAYNPQSNNTRTVLTAASQTGLFKYSTTNGTSEVNLLDLAARNGQLATTDPTIIALLNDFRTATTKEGSLADNAANPNVQSWSYASIGHKREVYPTLRVDLNINDAHRLSVVTVNQTTLDRPFGGLFAQFPGAAPPTSLSTKRRTWSTTLRSTLSNSTVNEFIFGGQRSPHGDQNELEVPWWNNMKGYQVNFGSGLSNVYGNNQWEFDITPNYDFSDTLSTLKGAHSLTFGGDFTYNGYDKELGNLVPTANFGILSGDPAEAMFNSTNFPGASATNLTDARSLYALLTGRVNSINAVATVDTDTGKYVYMGLPRDFVKVQFFGAFAQDSWRVRPGLTLNLGLRWDYQTPVQAMASNYSYATFADVCGVSGSGSGLEGRDCSLFTPGTLGGKTPSYTQLQARTAVYDADWQNFAPSVGFAWQPGVESGWGRKVLGDPAQTTIRGGYSTAYTRNSIGDMAAVFGGNPGRTIAANRSSANGNILLPGQTAPLLFRDTGSLGPPQTCAPGVVSASCILEAPVFPIGATTANNISVFDPNLKLSYAESYSIGLSRALGRDMAVEVRYVGTKTHGAWGTENWNEINLGSNGFLNEFKQAMSNLSANMAAGRGSSFAYFGPNSGTAPLPIFLAHLNAAPASQASDPSKYTGSNWTNSTLVGFLAVNGPQAANAASNATVGLYANAAFRGNGRTAGLPTNFWVMNPDVGQANVRRNLNNSKYDSLQIDVTRRFSRGFFGTGSYTRAVQSNTRIDTLSRPGYLAQNPNVPHSWKFNGLLEIPYGRSLRWGSDARPWLNTLLGKWSVSAVGRYYKQYVAQSGIRLVGMSQKDLQDAYKIRIDYAAQTVYLLPDDIILNTRRAFSVSATSADGYSSLGAPQGRYIAPASYPGCVAVFRGDCGEPNQILLLAPWFAKTDLTFKKQIPLHGTKNIDVQFDFLNLFGNVNWNPVFNPGSAANIFQVTSGATSGNGTFEPGGQIGQLMFRFNF